MACTIFLFLQAISNTNHTSNVISLHRIHSLNDFNNMIYMKSLKDVDNIHNISTTNIHIDTNMKITVYSVSGIDCENVNKIRDTSMFVTIIFALLLSIVNINNLVSIVSTIEVIDSD